MTINNKTLGGLFFMLCVMCVWLILAAMGLDYPEVKFILGAGVVCGGIAMMDVEVKSERD